MTALLRALSALSRSVAAALTVLAGLAVLAGLVLTASPSYATPANEAAPARAPGSVIVSLTFDDGFADQQAAVALLDKHRVKATFYIVDGAVRYDAYMTWSQIRDLASAGHEIGGHTVDHPHLSELSVKEQRHQICDDRATLLKLGFSVTSFAYPYGDAAPPLDKLVRSCGYNSARDVSGLVDRTSCGDCPLANPLPVPDRYRVRANSSTTTLSTLKQYVRQAMAEEGARVYVPLIFHHVCDPCASSTTDEQISPRDLDTFLTWLKKQPSVQVKTVHEAVGGPVRPSVGTPVASSLKRAAKAASAGDVDEPRAEASPASEDAGSSTVRLLGVTVGKPTLVVGGVLLLGLAGLGLGLVTRRRRGRTTG